MQSPDSQKIIKRFFKVVYMLKARGEIRGKGTFARMYGADRANINVLEKNLESHIFQPAWLTYLVRDFGVSADYLLTGKGKIFRE